MNNSLPLVGDLVKLVAHTEIHEFLYFDGYTKIVKDNDNWSQTVFSDWEPDLTILLEPGAYASIVSYGVLKGVTLPVTRVFISHGKLKEPCDMTVKFEPGYYWVKNECLGPLVDI